MRNIYQQILATVYRAGRDASLAKFGPVCPYKRSDLAAEWWRGWKDHRFRSPQITFYEKIEYMKLWGAEIEQTSKLWFVSAGDFISSGNNDLEAWDDLVNDDDIWGELVQIAINTPPCPNCGHILHVLYVGQDLQHMATTGEVAFTWECQDCYQVFRASKQPL